MPTVLALPIVRASITPIPFQEPAFYVQGIALPAIKMLALLAKTTSKLIKSVRTVCRSNAHQVSATPAIMQVKPTLACANNATRAVRHALTTPNNA